MSIDTIAYIRLTKMAWRNVIRNWRHSLATLFSIACGFIAISLFDGYLNDLRGRIHDNFITRAMMGHVIIEKKGMQQFGHEDSWAYSLGENEQRFLEDFLKNDPAVRVRVRFLTLAGILNAGRNNPYVVGYGYDVKEGAELRGKKWAWNVIAGVPLHMTKETSIVLGGKMGESIDCEFAKTSVAIDKDEEAIALERPFKCPVKRAFLSVTTEHSQVNAIDYPITGMVDGVVISADRHLVQMPLKEAQRILDTDKLSMVTVALKSEEMIGGFVARLGEAARKNNLALDIVPSADHEVASYLTGGLQTLSVFRNLFMVVLIVIGIMSVINTMTKAVNERIREIGTLRSLGFFRHHLVYMFSAEGLFLSVLACVVGFFLTVVLSYGITSTGYSYDAGLFSNPIPLAIIFAPAAWLVSVVLFSVLAMGSAWFCSRRACHMVIADAMRHVE